MGRVSGVTAQRTHKVFKKGSFSRIELPCCNVCGAKMDEPHIPDIELWRKGMKRVQKYPFHEVFAICPPCREKRNEHGTHFVMVPRRPEQSHLEALQQAIDDLKATVDINEC